MGAETYGVQFLNRSIELCIFVDKPGNCTLEGTGWKGYNMNSKSPFHFFVTTTPTYGSQLQAEKVDRVEGSIQWLWFSEAEILCENVVQGMGFGAGHLS